MIIKEEGMCVCVCVCVFDVLCVVLRVSYLRGIVYLCVYVCVCVSVTHVVVLLCEALAGPFFVERGGFVFNQYHLLDNLIKIIFYTNITSLNQI